MQLLPLTMPSATQDTSASTKYITWPNKSWCTHFIDLEKRNAVYHWWWHWNHMMVILVPMVFTWPKKLFCILFPSSLNKCSGCIDETVCISDITWPKSYIAHCFSCLDQMNARCCLQCHWHGMMLMPVPRV